MSEEYDWRDPIFRELDAMIFSGVDSSKRRSNLQRSEIDSMVRIFVDTYGTEVRPEKIPEAPICRYCERRGHVYRKGSHWRCQWCGKGWKVE
jgi:hypothetical protein